MSDSWDGFDSECYGCGVYGVVDSQSLCESCAAKLERDLIRQRAWDYSWHAFACSPEEREKLRSEVIAKYGKALELVAGEPERRRSCRRRRR